MANGHHDPITLIVRTNYRNQRKSFGIRHTETRQALARMGRALLRTRAGGGEIEEGSAGGCPGALPEITKGKAKKKFQEILRPLNEGLVSLAQAMTFADFCVRWKKDILENYRPSTKWFYGATLDRWILPSFGNWPPGDIKAPDVQTFVNQFGGYILRRGFADFRPIGRDLTL